MKTKTKKKLLITAVVIIAPILLFKVLLFILPFPHLNHFVQRQNSTRFYDRNGELLQILSLEEGLRREWYPLEELPPELLEIFIAAEDKNFYRHGGIDFLAVMRAAWQNIRHKKTVSGASTITMQLARLIYPRSSDESLITAKIRETWLALRIESRLPKETILELYLNSLPFGRQAEGVGSALRTYFGITPSQTSIAHLYALAVIPRRPSLYDPIKNPQGVYEQAIQIDTEPTFEFTYDQWVAQLTPPTKPTYPTKAQHFILYIISEYKKTNTTLPPELHLTLDNRLNDYIAELINNKLEQYAYARLSNGSALAIDNKTGEILVWVGNGDFDDERGGQIDGVLVQNQPGSSMKPFLYALGIERGIGPTTIFADVPQEFGAENVYIPMNFNKRYNGPQSIRVSLASSLNVPAVNLLYRLGVKNYMELLQKLKFTSLDRESTTIGLSLALGSGEVSLFELVRGFSAFPMDGTPIEPIFISTKKTDIQQTTKTENKPPRAFSSDTARIICDFLSDKSARSLGFGTNNVFVTEYPSMFKTGTSNQFQDIVAVGLTPAYTVGCWMGNFSGETVIQKTGSTIPALIVRSTLDSLMETTTISGTLPEKFKEPQHYTKQNVCALSIMIPTEACTSQVEEFLPRGRASEQLQNCNWHYIAENKIRVRYPPEYQRWFSTQRNISGTLEASEHFGETENNNATNREGETRLNFISPLNNSVFIYDPSIESNSQQIRVDCIGGSGDSASLYLNGTLLKEQTRPYIWYVPILPGTHQLEVRDDSGETAHINIDVQGTL